MMKIINSMLFRFKSIMAELPFISARAADLSAIALATAETLCEGGAARSSLPNLRSFDEVGGRVGGATSLKRSRVYREMRRLKSCLYLKHFSIHFCFAKTLELHGINASFYTELTLFICFYKISTS